MTLEELTTAYAALANGGGYAPLRFTHSASPAASERQILSPSSAYMVTDILSGAERPDLPSYAAAAAALPRIAFKTGTSYGRRDAWCIGYSARYTVGVWIGNVTHLGNPELVGSRSAAPLLVDIFNSLGGGTGEPIMAAPRDLAMRLVCAESGLPPGDRCRQLIEDVYSRERSSTARCSLCAEYLVSAGGTTTYCTSCVADHPYTARTFLNYPPELRAFWRATGVSVAAPPPHDRACGRVFPGDGPSLVSPSDNTTYYLFSPRQRVTLQASSPCDVTEQCWYVNDRFLGRVRAGTRLLVHLEPGAYAVTCVDDKGRSTQVRLTIKRLA